MATVLGRCLCRRILPTKKILDATLLYPGSVLSFHSQQKNVVYPCGILTTQFQHHVGKFHPYSHILVLQSSDVSIKYYSTNTNDDKGKNEKKLTLFQRFKHMYKNYWYVLLPVHIATSAVWFGGFYYLAKSGVDIASLLESMHISEKIIKPLRDSSMGYIAVAYALYKIATPARYTVTLAGTTVSINYLKRWGYIKPVPSAEQLKELYIEKRDNLMETMRETKEELMNKADKFKDQKDNIMDDFEKSIKKFKETSSESIKNKKKDIVENINKTLQKGPTK